MAKRSKQEEIQNATNNIELTWSNSYCTFVLHLFLKFSIKLETFALL